MDSGFIFATVNVGMSMFSGLSRVFVNTKIRRRVLRYKCICWLSGDDVASLCKHCSRRYVG